MKQLEDIVAEERKAAASVIIKGNTQVKPTSVAGKSQCFL